MGFLSSIANQNSTCLGGEVAQLHTVVEVKAFNRLRPNSEQNQYSPTNIHRLSRDEVMRMNKMITKVKMSCYFINFCQLIL